MMGDICVKALILAAGEGTRLRPLTLERPKPMLPVAGRPLLEHIIAWLRHHGIREVAINLHYKPRTITSYFGDGSAFGVEITYSHEDRILGTAGAAWKLRDFLDPPAETRDFREPFVVVYGDVLTDLDLGALLAFHQSQASACDTSCLTMALYRVPNPTEVGLVGLADSEGGRVTRFLEKPVAEEVFTDLANSGILVVEPGIVAHVPPGVFWDFGNNVFPQLLAEGVPMFGWPIPEDTYLIDIGSPESYQRVQAEWTGVLSRTPAPDRKRIASALSDQEATT